MKTVTGMGGMGGARELAEMLRQMGRGRDTVLAHITPEEAQMLLEQGGAGTMNPMTGLPEFQDADMQGDENFYNYDVEAQPGGYYGDIPGAAYLPGSNTTLLQRGDGENFTNYIVSPGADGPRYSQVGPTGDLIGSARGIEGPFIPEDIGFGAGRFAPTYGAADVAGMGAEQFARFTEAAQAQPQQPGFLDQLGRRVEAADAYLRERPGLAKVLGFGAQGLVGYLQAQRARAQGAEEARRFSKLGRPLKEQGEALRTQALAGQLTPQQAASQQARLASMRQAGANRGVTTGTQQAMIENQLARERAQLSETNLNNALKILNLANAYDEAAIRARLASDREADDLLSNILTNIGFNVASGIRRQQQQPQQEITRRPEIPRGA